MSDDLVADLRAIDASYVCNRPQWTIAKCHAAADRIEALEAVVNAAHGLSFGTDWNNGNHAQMHGYRNALLVALGRLKGDKASPAAIRALKEKE